MVWCYGGAGVSSYICYNSNAKRVLLNILNYWCLVSLPASAGPAAGKNDNSCSWIYSLLDFLTTSIDVEPWKLINSGIFRLLLQHHHHHHSPHWHCLTPFQESYVELDNSKAQSQRQIEQKVWSVNTCRPVPFIMCSIWLSDWNLNQTTRWSRLTPRRSCVSE